MTKEQKVEKMTVYEFAKSFKPIEVCKKKAGTYDVSIVESRLTRGSVDHRKNRKYAEAEDLFFDMTSACTVEEATYWSEFWIANAIAYGIQTQDLDWVYMFLAAYDLYEHLTSRKNRLYVKYD